MRLSQLLSSIGLLAVFPMALLVAYIGHRMGLYTYNRLPTVVITILLIALIIVFTLLPRLKQREERRLEQQRYEREKGE